MSIVEIGSAKPKRRLEPDHFHPGLTSSWTGESTSMGLFPLLGDIISGVLGISKISCASKASLIVGGRGEGDREDLGEKGSESAG